LVITWVDTNDPNWGKRYQQAYHELHQAGHGADILSHTQPTQDTGQDTSQDITRYHTKPEGTTHGELYYAVKLAEKHLPWLRQIVLFTQRPQRPSWTSEVPKLRVVHHDEVFQTPTFSGMVTTVQSKCVER